MPTIMLVNCCYRMSSDGLNNSMSILKPRLKRKQTTDDSNESSISLSEQIKRFRITVTPGELRMQKDLTDLNNATGIEFEDLSQPATIVVRFTDTLTACPNRFQIKVPRFYPHENPIVLCLDTGYRNKFINADGLLSHPSLGRDWTALGTLTTVLCILQNIRICFSQQPCQNIYSTDLIQVDDTEMSGSDVLDFNT